MMLINLKILSPVQKLELTLLPLAILRIYKTTFFEGCCSWCLLSDMSLTPNYSNNLISSFFLVEMFALLEDTFLTSFIIGKCQLLSRKERKPREQKRENFHQYFKIFMSKTKCECECCCRYHQNMCGESIEGCNPCW